MMLATAAMGIVAVWPPRSARVTGHHEHFVRIGLEKRCRRSAITDGACEQSLLAGH